MSKYDHQVQCRISELADILASVPLPCRIEVNTYMIRLDETKNSYDSVCGEFHRPEWIKVIKLYGESNRRLANNAASCNVIWHFEATCNTTWKHVKSLHPLLNICTKQIRFSHYESCHFMIKRWRFMQVKLSSLMSNRSSKTNHKRFSANIWSGINTCSHMTLCY